MEIYIILALSLSLLILLLVPWKDRRARREDEALLIQETLGALQTQISQLENLVKALPQDNQIKALLTGIFRLELVRLGLAKDNRLNFRNLPPDLSADNDYWGRLSRWIRKEKQWTCENERCRINLEERQSDLHVHHIFGRGFNSPQHLKVLCIACHAEEPGHGFMKAHPEYKAFLKWKRRLLTTKPKRRRFTPEFKAKVVREALSGKSSQAEVCRRHNLSDEQLSQWKRQLLENAASLFESSDKPSDAAMARIEQLE